MIFCFLEYILILYKLTLCPSAPANPRLARACDRMIRPLPWDPVGGMVLLTLI